jgi:subtilisin family serine protease
MRRSAPFIAVMAVFAAVLAACAPTRPDLDGPEYRLSWGLAAINAEPAYKAGATGRGVVVALIDCGLDDAQPEVARNVRASMDLFAGQRTVADFDRHASYVASPLGSALNGKGLLGVAYNASLLAIRADIDGGHNGECAFKPSDLARAVSYAADRKARIIVLPVQATRPMGAPFEAALAKAVDAGAVLVIAAGNRAGDQPSYPARYAADPRYAGAIVVVGAASMEGVLSRWSNKAGPAQAHYLVAPGENIITDCGEDSCRRVSGTSFAAPYVAGALALVMEAHPDLDGRQAAELLLSAARDAGEPGDDPVYGRGLLDIGKAFDGVRKVRRHG